MKRQIFHKLEASNRKPAAQMMTDAYLRLRREILHGELLPGERLRVADLQARFGLGLTPIREALMRLASEGLVDSPAKRGARVRRTTIAELHDLMETRRKVEAWCLAQSMAKGNAGWEAEILSSLHLLARASLPDSPADLERAEEWEKLHRAFHLALVSACGSEWQLRIWNMLVDHSERYRKLRLLHRGTPALDVRNVNAEHDAIARAVIDRDSDTALDLMDQHLRRTEEVVSRLLMESGAEDD